MNEMSLRPRGEEWISDTDFPEALQEWRTRMRLFSGGSSLVAVVQAADLGHRDDRPDFWPRNGSWLGRVLPQGEMRSGSVIVSERSILRTLSLCHQHLLTGLQARFSEQTRSRRLESPRHCRVLAHRSRAARATPGNKCRPAQSTKTSLRTHQEKEFR